jgi:glycine/sarcosine N-methyltransferase
LVTDGDESPRVFYDALASHYDVLFDDWWTAAQRHGAIVGAELEGCGVPAGARILDCACGIGTQAIALAAGGYRVTGTDLSAQAIRRARAEAEAHEVAIDLMVADMRDVDTVAPGRYDAVICCDNSLPHLLDDRDLDRALGAIAHVLTPEGVFLASVRDYDRLRPERPTGTPSVLRTRADGRDIVGQAWEWSSDSTRLRIHLFVLRERDDGWHADVHTTWYRALTRAELTGALERARFADIAWREPSATGFYQPIVTARARP